MKKLYDKEGVVVTVDAGVRHLWVNGFCQGRANEGNRHKPVSPFMWDIIKLIDRKPKKILFIGCGAGILPSYFMDMGSKVTIIEPFQHILWVAHTFFNLSLNVIPLIGYWHDHSLHLDTYDCIVLDAYIGGEHGVGLYNEDFYAEAMAHLNPQGLLIINDVQDGKNIVTRRIR